MRVVVTIQHPAHVHFYRPVLEELRADGHEVHVFVREKDVALGLLEAYDIPHTVLAGQPASRFTLPAVQAAYEYRLLRAARELRPDVMTAIGGVAVSHVAPLVGARSVVFIDNEGVASTQLTAPFAHAVCTPTWFAEDLGSGHRRYDGFHELAYLHPDRFDPDPDRLRAAGVDPHEPYFVLRFVAWQAHHDVGQHGLSSSARGALVDLLEEHGSVYVTAEGGLPPAFEPYRLPVEPHRVHDLLAFADCYVGDSQTMATEAALLATPAVRANSFAGEDDMTNFRELQRAGLAYSYADEERAIERVRTLVEAPTPAGTWRRRRDAFLADKVDVTGFVRDVLLEEGERARQNRDGRGRLLRRMGRRVAAVVD
jgi:hypothetical protein